jgi:hypothetical protein
MSSAVQQFNAIPREIDAQYLEEQLISLEEYLEYKKTTFFELTEQLSECVNNWYYENSDTDDEFCIELKNNIAMLKKEKVIIEKHIGQITAEIRYQSRMLRQLKGEKPTAEDEEEFALKKRFEELSRSLGISESVIEGISVEGEQNPNYLNFWSEKIAICEKAGFA